MSFIAPRVRSPLSGIGVTLCLAACGGLAASAVPPTRSPEGQATSDPQEGIAACMSSSFVASEGPPLPESADPRSPLVDLSVSGFPDAVVAPPVRLEGVRPVLIVLHGLRGRPETNCEAWRAITGGREAFILCPRGEYEARWSTTADKRYTLRGGETLRRHVAAALDALEQRFAGYVDVTQPALAGFSLGASEAALLAQSAPDRYPRVAIVEGGVDVWYGPTMAVFATHGGKRVLFGCGSSWCTPSARRATKYIEKKGVQAHLVTTDVGHAYGAALEEAIRDNLDWFFEGDPRWDAVASTAAGDPQ